MKSILLTKGHAALVDDLDFDFVSQWKWCADASSRTVYAIRGFKISGRQFSERLHVALARHWGWTCDRVDHQDGNGLHNWRGNLRPATFQNMANQSKTRGTSRFKGVHWLNREKIWRARIGVDHRYLTLGYFKDEEAAARAYDLAAVEHHKEFAKLNFPD
jgi:hypothetical protein